jgi:hypothetical protein
MGIQKLKIQGNKIIFAKNDGSQDLYFDKRENKISYTYNKFPLNFKFIIIPQLQIDFDQFSMKLQIYQDLFNIDKYIEVINIGSFNYTTFTGFGVVICANSKTNRTNLNTNKDYDNSL